MYYYVAQKSFSSFFALKNTLEIVFWQTPIFFSSFFLKSSNLMGETVENYYFTLCWIWKVKKMRNRQKNESDWLLAVWCVWLHFRSNNGNFRISAFYYNQYTLRIVFLVSTTLRCYPFNWLVGRLNWVIN